MIFLKVTAGYYGANGSHPLCQDFLSDNYPLVLSGCAQLLLHFEFTSPKCNILVEKFNFWSHWCICHVKNKGSDAFKTFLYSVSHCTHSGLSKEQINHFKHSNIQKIKAQSMQIWKCNTAAAAQREVCAEESFTANKSSLPYCERVFFKSTWHFPLLTPSHTANKMNCYLSFVTVNCMQYRFIITLESTENTKHF